MGGRAHADAGTWVLAYVCGSTVVRLAPAVLAHAIPVLVGVVRCSVACIAAWEANKQFGARADDRAVTRDAPFRTEARDQDALLGWVWVWV